MESCQGYPTSGKFKTTPKRSCGYLMNEILSQDSLFQCNHSASTVQAYL